MSMQVANLTEHLAEKRYHELLRAGAEPYDAAWQASEEFGLVNGDDVDPMAPDYLALSREPLPMTAGRDSRESAGMQ